MARFEDLSVGRLTITGDKKVGVPSNGTTGYDSGSLIQYRGSGTNLGAVPCWINVGDKTSALFVPYGPQKGYGIYRAGGTIASAGGDTTETITVSDGLDNWDIGFAGHGASDDTDNIVAAKLTDKTITITGSADPLTAHGYNYGVIRQGCVAEWDIVFAGTHTTVGGAAAEAITITGVLATDIAFVCYGATNDTDTIAKAVCTKNTLTVTCSADPSTAHSIHYMIIRPRGTTKASHYIAYAGLHTTVGGAAAEAVTITGAKSTDIPIVGYSATNDTDTILKAVMTTDTMTVTCSADPSTVHGFWYLILRAYDTF
jgi:hypothetical protein